MKVFIWIFFVSSSVVCSLDTCVYTAWIHNLFKPIRIFVFGLVSLATFLLWWLLKYFIWQPETETENCKHWYLHADLKMRIICKSICRNNEWKWKRNPFEVDLILQMISGCAQRRIDFNQNGTTFSSRWWFSQRIMTLFRLKQYFIAAVNPSRNLSVTGGSEMMRKNVHLFKGCSTWCKALKGLFSEFANHQRINGILFIQKVVLRVNKVLEKAVINYSNTQKVNGPFKENVVTVRIWFKRDMTWFSKT